ncbi:MAG: vitamin K epoxide reductase family protein [Actinobacteria bacterium]|nr:vitamin K epoxide reductase family protein [Actinomycetota bacterium]
MSGDQPDQSIEQQAATNLWLLAFVALLGAWLVFAPSTLGYGDPGEATAAVGETTSTRQLSPIATRGQWMTWSDMASGIALMAFAALSLDARRYWSRWAACLVGVWLMFAPLVFWAPDEAAYLNGVLVGALVVALTVLIPEMPGMPAIMKPGPERPPGWSYNPSSWLQRTPVIALGWLGFFFARLMAAYQFGYIDNLWDPFFGDGTEQILDSDISMAWPVSDAGLGVFAYTLEALMGYMGGTDRWRTMPWMVTFFGFLVIPLSGVSIFLIMMQPVSVGTWSTYALVTAAAMLVMIPLTLDEVAAMVQFVVRKRREGAGIWHTFWFGGTVEGGGADDRSPRYPATVGAAAQASVWGMTMPPTLLASAAVGIWLMAAPAVLGTAGGAADSDHIIGALVVCIAVVAMAEIGRTLRLLDVGFGAWLIVAPLVVEGGSPAYTVSSLACGAALVALSLPRGAVRERYGTLDRLVR